MLKTETGALTKQRIVAELTRSAHGKLQEYTTVGRQAAKTDPEFFSHLVAWDAAKGQVRDAHVALPVLALHTPELIEDREFKDNALAHLAMLSPRDLRRALSFSKDLKGGREWRQRLVADYLRAREAEWDWWERTALQHRTTLRELYAVFHVKPSAQADRVLFKGQYTKGTALAALAELKTLTPLQAAAAIMKHKLPFLAVTGALGDKAKDPDLVLALIGRMTPTELVTNSKALEKLGIKTVPALRAAYEEALGKAAESKKATLKTTKAAEAVADTKTKAQLKATQEKQLDKLGIKGDWLVACDKSGSMAHALKVAQQVAETLARLAQGSVYLVFFDTMPQGYDVSGKTYDEIVALTRRIRAGGGTAPGVALRWLAASGAQVSGMAVVSDGEENQHPLFAPAYREYAELIGSEPPVYFYKCGTGEPFLRNCSVGGIEVQTFDIPASIDYYSIPNMAQTMRASRYSLTDEIMGTPLKTLREALRQKGEAA